VIASTGRGPIIVLYPSVIQVYPEIFEVTKRAVEKQHVNIDPSDFDPTFPNRVLLEKCLRANLSCYDVTSAMINAAAEKPDPLYYLPRDGHWNVRGNRVAAAAEAAFLQEALCKPADH
jgi:hypothetical protein